MDIDLITSQVVPYIAAFFGTYGARSLEKVGDKAVDASADAVADVGRRAWERLKKTSHAATIEAAADEVTTEPDEDSLGMLHFAVRKALRADPGAAADLESLVAESGMEMNSYTVTITNSENVIVGSRNVLRSESDKRS